MRCQRAQQLYDDYTRGSLPLVTLTRIEDHLAGCPQCREEYDLNDRIAAAMHAATEVAHPGSEYFESLSQRVLNRLNDPQQTEHLAPIPDFAATAGWRRPLWWSGALAAAALLTLGLFGNAPLGVNALLIASPPADGEPGLEYFRSPNMPTIVVSSDKRELVLNKVLEGSLHSEPQLAQGTEAGPASKSVEKSRVAQNSADAEKAVVTAAAPPVVNPGATPAGEIQTVSLKPVQPEVPAQDQMAAEIQEQIDQIREQMLSEGGTEIVDQLRKLDAAIEARAYGDSSLKALPSVRQIRLYLRAEEALGSGRPEDACTLYQQILLIDQQSPLALRSELQLADLYYSEWADFAQAQKFYQQSRQAVDADKVFSPTELEHVGRRLERLETQKADGWKALHLLHAIQRPAKGWAEVNAAIGQLTQIQGSESLLPEAARAIVDQVQVEPGPPLEVAIDIYKILENRAHSEQNGSVRAWLEVTLGDLQLLQFQEVQAAINHYTKAIDAGTDSGAAQLARTKRDQLIDRQFLDFVR